MAPFGGDWNEDPKEFLDWFFQCMGTAGDEFKAKQFIYYLQAGSYADEWYEELPQQEQQNWVSVEALFQKRWLKEEVISIKETITIENEHQPAPTTSHIITLDPIHDSEADSQDISEGDDERNERNVSHDVTTTSPTATTTLFDQKPLPSPESTHKLCLDTTQQHLVAPSTLLITPRQPQNTSQAVATSLSTPVPFRAPCHQKPSESAETFRKLLQEPSEGIQDTSRRTGYPNFEKKSTDFTQSPSYPPRRTDFAQTASEHLRNTATTFSDPNKTQNANSRLHFRSNHQNPQFRPTHPSYPPRRTDFARTASERLRNTSTTLSDLNETQNANSRPHFCSNH